jgi:hypothetical protein
LQNGKNDKPDCLLLGRFCIPSPYRQRRLFQAIFRRMGTPTGFRGVSLTPGVVVKRRYTVGMASVSSCGKVTRIAPLAMPDAWNVAEGGHIPGIRQKSHPDERLIILF